MEGRILVVAVLTGREHSAGELDTLRDEMLRRIGARYPDAPVYGTAGTGPERTLKDGSTSELIRILEEAGAGPDDSVALFRGLAPFLDSALLDEMEEEHIRYLAHASYPENIPPGFLPELYSLEFLRMLPAGFHGDLRAHVQKNLNDFDVEIFYRLPDLRQLRLDLSCGTPRSRRLAREIYERSPALAYGDLEGFLRENSGVLRPYPSYLELELTTASPANSLLLPDAGDERELPFGLIESWTKQLPDFLGGGSLTVALGGRGEPLLHTRIREILESLLASPAVERVYLETYGRELTPQFCDDIAALEGANKLHVIFRLTTLRRDRYREIYGTDGLEAVLENLEALERRASGERPFTLYAEILRINEVEDEIAPYQDRFSGSPVSVIIQKYNRYIDLLPERRISDLTPLHREFCWHLARDLYVTADGIVPLCKQDPLAAGDVARSMGDLSLEEIWRSGEEHFRHSYRGEHDMLPMPCARCDEWYTFNA